MAKSQSGHNNQDGIYTSLRRPLLLPNQPNLSMVSFLFRNSNLYPDKPALIDADSGDTLSFSQFKSTVANLSHGLHQLGITKNDVVLLYAPNSIQFPVSFFSIIALGAIATTVNPIYTVREISKQVKDCKPKLIITVAELWDKVKGFNLPFVILGSEKLTQSMQQYPNSKITLYNDLIKNSNPGSVLELPNVQINRSDTAALLYSSGTTGTSKGVMLSHGNFIAAATMVANDQDVQGEMHSVLLCVLPMFHVFGLATLNYAQLQRGNAVVSMAKFDFVTILKSIEKYRVTHFWVVPPIVLALAKQGAVLKKFDLSSLKEIGCGAAPLGKDLMEECAKNFPQAVIVQVILCFLLISLFALYDGSDD